MAQLKVSTNNSISPKEKEEKVLNILKEHPEGIYPKFIALYTGININTVKSILQRLEQKGIVKLKEGLRGIYELVENDTHSSIFDWNFQNTRLSCPLSNYTGEKIDTTLDFEFITYHFQIGKDSQQASIHIIADRPINLSSICVCFSYFSLLVKQYTSYLPKLEDTTISCIEFNQDYANLKFEGVKCITLTELFNQFKIYQKENCVRAEHKILVPIKAEAITSLLMNQTPYLSMLHNINIIKSKQNSVDKNLKKLSKIIPVLLDKFDKKKIKNDFKQYY